MSRRVRRRGGRAVGVRRAATASAGAVAVEFGLILPLLIFMMIPLFDLGFAAVESMAVQAAAEAGAQYAATHSWNPAAIANAVTSATGIGGIAATPAPSQFCACAAGGVLTDVGCDQSCPNGGAPGLYGLVQARRQHFTVLHYPGLPDPLVLTGQAIRRLR